MLTYNFSDLKLLHQIETLGNSRGLLALSSTADTTVLACPGLHTGQVRRAAVQHGIAQRGAAQCGAAQRGAAHDAMAAAPAVAASRLAAAQHHTAQQGIQQWQQQHSNAKYQCVTRDAYTVTVSRWSSLSCGVTAEPCCHPAAAGAAAGGLTPCPDRCALSCMTASRPSSSAPTTRRWCASRCPWMASGWLLPATRARWCGCGTQQMDSCCRWVWVAGCGGTGAGS